MKKIIEPVINLQSYKNLFYMLTAFVFSNIYLIFFVAGFSISLGLSFILVGIPLLIFFLYLVRQVGKWEILLANGFLDTQIEEKNGSGNDQNDIFKKVRNLFTDVRLWKRMLYLMLKYPFDLAVFVIIIMFFTLAIKCTFAPLLFAFSQFDHSFVGWLRDLTGSSLIVSVIGVIMLIFSFHLANGLAEIYKKFTGYFLSNE